MHVITPWHRAQSPLKFPSVYVATIVIRLSSSQQPLVVLALSQMNQFVSYDPIFKRLI